MLIGDMILGNEVQVTSNNQTLITVPNNIFPVLSTPAFISFGAAIVMSGMDLNQKLDLVVEFKELEDTDSSIIFQENIPENPAQMDPNPSLSANLSLRNVRVNNLGHHKVILKLDGTVLSESIINIVEAE